MKKSSRNNSSDRDPGSGRSKGEPQPEKSKLAKKEDTKVQKRGSQAFKQPESASKPGLIRPQQVNAFERIRFEKQGNEVYKNLIQIHTNLKMRSYENMKVDQEKLNQLVQEMIGLQTKINEKTEILRAYYTLVDKDSKVILEELVSTQAGSNLVDLVNNVKDSQKHFYLFLLNARNTMFSQSPKADRNKKSAANDKQNIMSVLTEFNNELVEYVNSVASLENLKATKEQMFPYSNTAILDDFKKINSLSLIIKLLKKDQRTEAEDIKIKTFFENKKLPLDDKKTHGGDWELNTNAVNALTAIGNEDESPTLKKLKDLNKKYYSDKLEKKK